MGLFDLFRKKGWEGEVDLIREQKWSDHFAFTRYLKKERDGD